MKTGLDVRYAVEMTMSSSDRLTEVTAQDTPRVFVDRVAHRIVLSYRQMLALVCMDCGGSVAIILLASPGDTGHVYLPRFDRMCRCNRQENNNHE